MRGFNFTVSLSKHEIVAKMNYVDFSDEKRIISMIIDLFGKVSHFEIHLILKVFE